MSTVEYYLGLDMGTNSIGWAVTDTQYNLIRKKGKDAWGIREFEEAATSVDRRTNRVSRRRRQREQVRIGLLKEYFAETIAEIDPCFYQRLDNSKYHPEDKDSEVHSKNALFDDVDFTDKDYYAKYPTIFHLRCAQLSNEADAFDPRLLYLSLLNMFKHRGHFLNQGLGDEDTGTAAVQAYYQFRNVAEEVLELYFAEDQAEKVIEILSDRTISRSVKAERICGCFGISKKDKNDIRPLLISCICGLKTDAKKIFKDVECEDKLEINFSDYGFDEKAAELQDKLGEDNFAIVESMKALSDAGNLAAILKGYEYLSMSRVADYEKHARDLKVLKKIYKEQLSQEAYDKMFRSDKDATYSAYVGSVNSDDYNGLEKKKLRRDMKGRARDLLYKQIKSDLKGKTGDDVNYVMAEMEKETFLPKQLTAGNGIIPNQVHKIEMRRILSNAEEYLTFLKEKDDTGLSVSEKILELFSFQIPYYIGPTSENSAANGGNGWVVRKEKGAVLPWNMKKLIDESATREQFIYRLIRECSYLHGEKVLPKGSLAYERYCVLNEINNLRIDGERISVSLKQDIYTELFEKGKKVSRTALIKYLQRRGAVESEDQVSGIDITINNSLTSYGRFHAIFGEELKKESVRNMVEDIISLCTIYGDAKKTLKEELTEKYGNKLTEKEIARILGYKFKDWGRLSGAILGLSGVNYETGEMLTINQALWETNYNFMELMNSEAFSFREALEEKKEGAFKSLSEFKAEDLDEYYFSAPVKRMVWQTLQLIEEINGIMGKEPKRIFIEMTRTDEEKGYKGRKASRKDALLALYKSIRNEEHDWEGEIEKADENGSLRSKKLYLYYRQMGICMYTGEPIDLYKLLNDNVYDIDHIYPRHFVKDDNIENNMVLVNKASNAYKSDNYPIPEVPGKAKLHWKMLHDRGFINDEKYHRLTSRTPFTEEQQAGFIARQLVETSQGTKGVADLLKQLMPESTIVYAKARNVSDFRKDYKFYKARSLNDLHHAKDAYLNIVVGNVYFVRFTQNPLNFIRKEYALDKEKNNYHLGKMFERDVQRKGETAWITPKGAEMGTLETVRKVMHKNTPIMTRLSFEVHGGIANATLYSRRKAKPENYFPLKTSDSRMQDVTKYGGFTSATVAYYFLVEHTLKKKRVRTLEAVPLYLKAQIEKDEDGLLNYCVNELKLVDPDIRLKKIKIQSLFRINGYDVHLSGKTGNRLILRNAVNLCIKPEWEEYVRKLEKVSEGRGGDAELSCEKNCELYDRLLQKHKESVYLKRPNPMGNLMGSGKGMFCELTFNEQCYVLLQICQLSAIGSYTADLKLIGGAELSGKMLLSKEISKNAQILMINQSCTGLYESAIDLLTV